LLPHLMHLLLVHEVHLLGLLRRHRLRLEED
jgi:hypothetical protein